MLQASLGISWQCISGTLAVPNTDDSSTCRPLVLASSQWPVAVMSLAAIAAVHFRAAIEKQSLMRLVTFEKAESFEHLDRSLQSSM